MANKLFFNKPEVDFLLIDDDLEWGERFKNSFDKNKGWYESQHNIELSIISVDIDIITQSNKDDIKIQRINNKILNPGDVAIKLLKDSDLTKNVQGILLDWDLKSSFQQIELIHAIKRLRPLLSIYIITQSRDEDIFTNLNTPIFDIFYKSDIEGHVKKIIPRLLSEYNERRESPFWNAYKSYVLKASDTWHTPGHCGGESFINSQYIQDFYEFFKDNVFNADLSVSVEKLGSLLESTSFILEGQKKAALTFGARKTFFVTNGSSTANKIIIQTVLKPEDQVIIDRNCHKSVHYGVIQSGAIPTYIESEYNSKLGIFAPPSFVDIKKVVDSTSSKLLILTGCTYEGILSYLKPIVKYCHDNNVKIMIDEAWFAYSRFHPNHINYSALESGADYVTHSSHKTLSAFSQASMIHVNDPDFDEDYFREIFCIYTSTSPQYQIIASLDVAATQMRMEGCKILSRVIDLANNFRKSIAVLKYIKVVNDEDYFKIFPHLKSENVSFDTLKVLIDFSETNLSTSEMLSKIRVGANLEIEKYTHSTILILFTIGTSERKVTRLIRELKRIDSFVNKKASINNKEDKKELPRTMELYPGITPANAFFGDRRKVHFLKSKGSVSAGLVTPYPPGIPLLVPSQVIKEEHIIYLTSLVSNSVEVHGLFEGYIYVVTVE